MPFHIKTVADLDHALAMEPGGGYELAFVTHDGGLLCETCVEDNRECIDDSIQSRASDGWLVVAAESTDMYEDGQTCDHCNKWMDAYHVPFEEGAHLIVNGAHGVYVPQNFAERYGANWKGISHDDLTILRAGPDHEHYWEAWDDVLDSAYFKEGSDKYTLYQTDGDLFAVHEDTYLGD